MLWLPAHQIQRFQACCWNSHFSSRGSVFLCSVSCLRRSDNKAACGFRFTFFFFSSQSYQEKENVPFLTKCCNISLGVGIPGWHGVLELTTQLAKSLLSLELLLQTMVHMHQYIICSFSFFLLPKEEGEDAETLERIKLGRFHYSKKPHYINPPVRLIYTKVISSSVLNGQVINRPFKGPQ